MTATDQTWLAQAVDLAVANVAAGGGPFGAVVVRDGAARRHRAEPGDPRHRPDRARRGARDPVGLRRLGDFSLAGCVLYTSCEPCPLCVSASLWARVDRVVYAADRHDAARGGFDDREFYELFARDRATWPTPVDEVRRTTRRSRRSPPGSRTTDRTALLTTGPEADDPSEP